MSFVGKQGQMRLVLAVLGGREEIERHSDMVKRKKDEIAIMTKENRLSNWPFCCKKFEHYY